MVSTEEMIAQEMPGAGRRLTHEEEDTGDERKKDAKDGVGGAIPWLPSPLEPRADGRSHPRCNEPREGDGGGDEATITQRGCVCRRYASWGQQLQVPNDARLQAELTGHDDLLGELQALSAE